MRSSPTALRLHRSSALLAVCFLVFGATFARALHWVSVPHRLCQVHGTFEHRDARERPPEDSVAHTRGPLYRAVGTEHEECSFGVFTRVEALVVAPLARSVAPVLEERGQLLSPASPLPEQPLFGLAPSRSPPA